MLSFSAEPAASALNWGLLTSPGVTTTSISRRLFGFISRATDGMRVGLGRKTIDWAAKVLWKVERRMAGGVSAQSIVAGHGLAEQ